ncbi:MAG: hypothetical protein R3F56_04870 [Planctomycetota bacterium]
MNPLRSWIVVAALAVVAASGAASGATAQQAAPATPIDLEPVRQTFASRPSGSDPVVVVVFRRDQEPLVLTSGTDATGAPLAENTLLPLGSAVRLLIADALFASAKAPADLDATGARVGDEKVSVRDLLLGRNLFPDWFALGPVPSPPERSTLLACAEVARHLGGTFRSTSAGLAELVLLREHVFDRNADWPAVLRTRLSPQGAGVDPIDLGQLAAAGGGRIAASVARVDALRVSAPDCARLALSLHDLLLWGQWRLQQKGMPHVGDRFGFAAPVDGREDHEVWLWGASAPVAWSFRRYLDADCELVVFGAPDVAPLQSALEKCLFGEPPARQRVFGGRFGGRAGTLRPAAEGLSGTWVPKGSDPATASLRLDIDGSVRRKIVLHWRDRRLVQQWLVSRTDGYEVTLATDGRTFVDRLLLWHDGEGEAERLRAAFVERSDAPPSAVPRQLDFVRAR